MSAFDSASAVDSASEAGAAGGAESPNPTSGNEADAGAAEPAKRGRGRPLGRKDSAPRKRKELKKRSPDSTRSPPRVGAIYIPDPNWQRWGPDYASPESRGFHSAPPSVAGGSNRPWSEVDPVTPQHSSWHGGSHAAALSGGVWGGSSRMVRSQSVDNFRFPSSQPAFSEVLRRGSGT
eukprot:226209-Rhodomonas_salina.1